MTDHIRDRVATAICAADPDYLAMADAAIAALEESGYAVVKLPEPMED